MFKKNSLHDHEFINFLLNPVKEDGKTPDPDGFYFAPLPDEVYFDEDSQTTKFKEGKSQEYLDRFFDILGNEQYKDYLISSKPNETTAGKIAYQNLWADSFIEAALEGRVEAPDVLTITSDNLV